MKTRIVFYVLVIVLITGVAIGYGQYVKLKCSKDHQASLTMKRDELSFRVQVLREALDDEAEMFLVKNDELRVMVEVTLPTKAAAIDSLRSVLLSLERQVDSVSVDGQNAWSKLMDLQNQFNEIHENLAKTKTDNKRLLALLNQSNKLLRGISESDSLRNSIDNTICTNDFEVLFTEGDLGWDLLNDDGSLSSPKNTTSLKIRFKRTKGIYSGSPTDTILLKVREITKQTGPAGQQIERDPYLIAMVNHVFRFDDGFGPYEAKMTILPSRKIKTGHQYIVEAVSRNGKILGKRTFRPTVKRGSRADE